MTEDWKNPWYATWRFSRLPKPAKAAVMAFIREIENEKQQSKKRTPPKAPPT